MATTKSAIYKVHNGTDFDIIHFETDIGSVKGLFTDSNKTYYVATTGNDTTGDGSSTKPYKTLQKVIDTLPRFVNHIITIIIKSGIYDGVRLDGFIGAGSIEIYGENSSSAASQSIASFYIKNTRIKTTLRLCQVVGSPIEAIKVENATLNISDIVIPAASANGISADSSTVSIYNSIISQRDSAIIGYNSLIRSSNVSGTGSNIGLVANGATIIAKEGTQPGGTIGEVAEKGGQIR